MKQFEEIEKITEAIETLNNAITSVTMSMKDVKSVLDIIDPDSASKMENVYNILSTCFCNMSESDTHADTPIDETPVIKTPVVVKESEVVPTTPTVHTPESEPLTITSNPRTPLTTIQLEELCKVLIDNNFSVSKSLKYCKEHNISGSYATLYRIRAKDRYTEVSDKYFTKDENGEYHIVGDVTEEKSETPVAVTDTTYSPVVLPPEVIVNKIKDALKENRNSIKRAYDELRVDDESVTIFDIFNVRYDGLRDKPIKNDDINVVVRNIAPDYDYNIKDINRVMKEKCDIYIEACHMSQIRKLARKAGRESGSCDRALTRKKTLSSDDDKIAHVLIRLDLNMLQTFLHFRATPFPVDVFKLYKVKKEIATITDYDIRTIVVNLRRSAGISNCGELADIIHENIGVVLSKREVENFLDEYNNSNNA
jgi:hypothetical protein